MQRQGEEVAKMVQLLGGELEAFSSAEGEARVSSYQAGRAALLGKQHEARNQGTPSGGYLRRQQGQS